MSDLPSNWIKASLQQCANINMGQSPEGKFVSESEEGLPFYQGKTEFGKCHPTPRKFCVKPTKIVQQNDILLSIRAPVGPTNICAEESCIGRGLAGIRAYDGISQQFLFKYFKHIEPWLSQQGTGSTFKAVSGGFLNEVEVLIAPLNEQIRIADKLDSLLAKVDEALARLEKIPTLLKRFRQSVLAAATSGELTKECKEQKEYPNWRIEDLNTIVENIVDCPHSTPDWTESGKLCVRTTAFKPFYLDLSEQKFVSDETYNNRIARMKPMAGDILYSREGAILGIACQIPEGVDLCLGQRMLIIRAGDRINAKYLTIVLNSKVITETVNALVIGNAAPRINIAAIKKFKIPLPTLAEQNEIVRRVESLFAQADAVEKQYLAAKQRLDRLSQSLLAKAFRGELVPQDPTDEPAAELLKRIQAERQAQPTSKHKRSKPT